MGRALRQPRSNLGHRPPPHRRALPALALILLLLLGSSLSALAHPGGATKAGGVYADLGLAAKLANREVRPRAQRLARNLPASVEGIQRLLEPASTGRAQIRLALDELRQMGAASTLDPHYLPALVAAGRAYVAISGQDPVTATTINPDYRGLETELAGQAAQLGGSASEAATLSARVKRLTRLLAAAKRRARRLERKMQTAPDTSREQR